MLQDNYRAQTTHPASRLIDEEIYIPMPDGTRLAARIWRPITASEHPVPAVLEYIPYRKRDDTRARDETLHPAIAVNGYACVRVDMRGSGDSEGLLLDEYLPIEQQDGAEVVEWLAKQAWCNGSVGMFGLSWGGITSLQVAALSPPSLKAIIPVGASVDRYYDDACYFVGCLAGETVGWGSVMFGYNSRPPDPLIYGASWKNAWLERLNAAPMFLETWLSHQRRDEYWLQGTICADYDRVKVPVYAMSGWNDCWPNTVLRLACNLKGPYKGLSGAWGHMYPNEAVPGPGANFVGEAVRWFDRWLKDINNGIEDEPALTCYIQDRGGKNALDDHRPGRWVDVESWNPDETDYLKLFPAPGSLGNAPCPAGVISLVDSPLSVGKACGEYMPLSRRKNNASLPGDQRIDDAGSTLFETAPLDEPMEFLGTPRIRLDVESSSTCGMVAVRLCDVGPNGESILITNGILNLAQREGRENPLEVESGKRYLVSVRLNDVGYRVAKGNRLRLAVSNSMWPLAWPLPLSHELTLHLAGCCLELPQPPCQQSDPQRELFKPSTEAMPGAVDVISDVENERLCLHDLTSGNHIYRIISNFGKACTKSTGITTDGKVEETFTIRDDDPLSAKADYKFQFGCQRPGWCVRSQGELKMTCDSANFYLEASLEAFEGDEYIFERRWNVSIPRDGF